jgi:hypothetical protein
VDGRLGTNQLTPMLLLYRARLGLPASVVEAVFAMYAIGLVPGLLAGGARSERIDRRRMVIRSSSDDLGDWRFRQHRRRTGAAARGRGAAGAGAGP